MSEQISTDKRKSWVNDDVDKGYAWFVLLGCFVMHMIVVGSFKAFGVLYTEMVETYSAGYGNSAWINGTAVAILLFLAPVGNLLSKVYTFRSVTMIGGVMLGLGYFLSGFVTKIDYMYLTFISVGIGYGLTFAPCSTIISYYFEKRRVLANGITVSGGGLGMIAFPFLYRYLIEEYGLRGSFWIIGAIFSNVCVAACLFKQPKLLVEEQKRVRADKDIKEEVKIVDSQSTCRKHNLNIDQKINKTLFAALDLRFSLFKKPLFTLYIVSFLFCTFGSTAILILLPASVKTLGYDNTYVALSVTIFGSVEVVARILIAWFADLNIIHRKNIYAVCMFIGGAFSFLPPFFDDFTVITASAAVIGALPGSLLIFAAVLIIDAVGLENFSAGFGLFSISLAVGILPSQPAVGWLYDIYGTWHSSFILTGCTFILAGVIVVLGPLILRRYWPKTDREEVEEQEAHDNVTAIDADCNGELESAATITS